MDKVTILIIVLVIILIGLGIVGFILDKANQRELKAMEKKTLNWYQYEDYEDITDE